MALTRKFLAALGIEPEKVDEIIEAHTDTVNALKKERDDAKSDAERYKEDADKLPGVQQELDDLKANHTSDPYKEKYDKEHADFEAYKADVVAKETKAKKAAAYRKLLKDSKISEKRLDAILKVTAVDDFELDDNGAIKDADKVKEAIKADWADFIVEEGTQGAKTPAGASGGASAGSAGGDANGGGKSRAAQVAAKHYAAIYGETKGETK